MVDVRSIPGIDRAMVDDAFQRAGPYAASIDGPAGAGLLPHHLLAAPLMAGLLERAVQPSVGRVVILGPDHAASARGPFVTTLASWQTPDGRLSNDRALIAQLMQRGLLAVDEGRIDSEHSVAFPLPFLARVAPRTTVTVIVVRPDARTQDVRALAIALDELLGPNDVVLGSVDFSHYRDAVGAWQDDERTLRAVRAMDAEAVLDAPTDSPPTLSLVMHYAARRHLHLRELAHTNSAELLGDLTLSSTTSYLTAAFVR